MLNTAYYACTSQVGVTIYCTLPSIRYAAKAGQQENAMIRAHIVIRRIATQGPNEQGMCNRERVTGQEKHAIFMVRFNEHPHAPSIRTQDNESFYYKNREGESESFEQRRQTHE